MGMPACTITSQTAHGGIVTVGFPTVLIGMMPASRIGDLHVCPMTTGPVPHVGGPFIRLLRCAHLPLKTPAQC